MFRRCFPFIVTVPKVPKDQREVGTSDHWVGACSRMLQHSWPSHCRSGHFLHKQKHKDLNILTDSPSERFFKSKKVVHPKSIGMLNFGTDPSGDSCPIFHQPFLGDIAMVSLQHSNLGKKKSMAAAIGQIGHNDVKLRHGNSGPPFLDFTWLHMCCAWRFDFKCMEFLSKCVHGILRVEAGWEVSGAGSKKNVLIPSHPSSWGSRACSLKGWKSLKVGWDPAQFEPDAMTCVIYVILQMPCIV